jgi:signal transduction histidine kinase
MFLLDISLLARVIIGISGMVVLFAGFLIVFINNQRKKIQYHKKLQLIFEEQQQALVQQNQLLEDRVKERTAELMEQKENLQKALKELKASQQQLVQKEKLASLGEMASGIAHEIQNPLNFVNNFSEVNADLLLELKELLGKEITSANLEEMQQLLEDVIQNDRKIGHHGKRAENIVKSLMQHSRTNSGEAVLSDINQLAEEFLKLGYHSFRTKDKMAHIELHSSFDKELEQVHIVPEDIGRVLMNLYNNAFYSVMAKVKKSIPGFTPVVSVITKKDDRVIRITVQDNGLGISEKNLSKIFQPFFTTKPTGEGTGLGLSLSYEIVKAHGGELKAFSKEGESATFVLELPVE